MEVSLIKYYCGTRTSVLNREVSFIRSVLYKEVPLYVHNTNFYSLTCCHCDMGHNKNGFEDMLVSLWHCAKAWCSHVHAALQLFRKHVHCISSFLNLVQKI